VREVEWLTEAEPERMLRYLKGKATDRKFRLLLVAWWRRRFGDLRSFKAYQKKLTQAEEMADGNWRPQRGKDWWIGHRPGPQANAVVSVERLARLRGRGHVSPETQADLIREVFGNPFRTVAIQQPWLERNDGAGRKIAQGIYDDRRFGDLPVLADALEEAGCDNADLLGHLRGPGPHVRGCWALDLLLGQP
jgi:hypothetical protein